MSTTPSLREEHAEQTRVRILDAFVELLAAGDVGEVSVPDVARRSGVSLRTIYRYYPTRDDLFDAAGDWIFRHTFAAVPVERALEELPSVFAAGAKEWEAHAQLAQAIAHSPASKALITTRRAQRYEQITREVEQAAPHLTDREQRQAAVVLGYLQSIRTWVTLRHDVGLSHEETVGAIDWALKTLIDDLRRRDRAAGRTQGGRK